MSVEVNQRCTICLMTRTDPAIDWQPGRELDLVRISMSVQVGVRLDDNTSSAAFTGKVARDDDPQTTLELLGI